MRTAAPAAIEGILPASAAEQRARRFGWCLLGIMALALAARVAWVLTLDRGQLLWYDEVEYWSMGRRLAEGQPYERMSYRGNPGLPLYISLIHRVVGDSFTAARLGQAAIGAATCVLVALIGRDLFGRRIGLIAGALLALYPAHIYMSGVLYAECLVMLFMFLALWLTVRVQNAPTLNWRPLALALLAGLVFGIAGLTRSLFLVTVPAAVLAILLASRLRPTHRIVPAVVVLVGVLVVIGPWMARSHRLYGKWMISSGFYTKLWQGNNELANGGALDRELWWNGSYLIGGLDRGGWDARLLAQPPAIQQQLRTKYGEIDKRVRAKNDAYGGDWYLATDEVLKPVALQSIRENPARTIKLFLLKQRTLYSAFSETLTPEARTPVNRVKILVAQVTFYPVLALAIASLVLLRRHWRSMLLPLAVISIVSFIYGILNAATRHRLPIDPMIILLAAFFAVAMYDRFRARRSAPVTSAP